MDILTHPLMYALAAIIGFFLKDLFNKVQKTGDLKTEVKAEIESLKTRVVALEVSHKEHSDMSKAVIRLEEQVKRLSEDIKYLLTLVRVQLNDKADAS